MGTQAKFSRVKGPDHPWVGFGKDRATISGTARKAGAEAIFSRTTGVIVSREGRGHDGGDRVWTAEPLAGHRGSQ